MASLTYSKPFLMDSSAIPFLWDKQLEAKIWRHFGETRQYVCAIVCYETYQVKPAYHPNGQLERFSAMIDDKKLVFLQREPQDAKAAADLAVAVTIDLKERFKDDKAKRKARFRELYHDILIAGFALSRNLTVFTDDPKDWDYLANVARQSKKFLTNLGVFTKKEAFSR